MINKFKDITLNEKKQNIKENLIKKQKEILIIQMILKKQVNLYGKKSKEKKQFKNMEIII